MGVGVGVGRVQVGSWAGGSLLQALQALSRREGAACAQQPRPANAPYRGPFLLAPPMLSHSNLPMLNMHASKESSSLLPLLVGCLQMKRHGLTVEGRTLPIGDVVWLARSRWGGMGRHAGRQADIRYACPSGSIPWLES